MGTYHPNIKVDVTLHTITFDPFQLERKLDYG